MLQIQSIVILVILTVASCSSVFTIIKHSIESGARCLDGSFAALYYSMGSDKNKNKFVIFFQGGGLCVGVSRAETLESCYRRSYTHWGSSSKYPATRNFSSHGILSGISEMNPMFYDWTRVYVPYCDGSLHQHTKLIPISYKNVSLYFRGGNNSAQQFEALNTKFGLYSADKVVLTGVSAGAMAVYYWSNYLYDRSLNKQVFSIPDSGLFLSDYVSPFTGRTLQEYTINLLKLMDPDTSPAFPECQKEYDDPMQCYKANRIAKYLKSPFFVIESQYDSWSINNILQLKCTGPTRVGTLTNCNQSEVKAIEDYRKANLAALKDFKVIKNIGIWAPSCIQHGFINSANFNSINYKIPSGSGITIAQAIKRFVENPGSGKHMYVDNEGWPNNNGCSGLTGPVRTRINSMTVSLQKSIIFKSENSNNRSNSNTLISHWISSF